MKKLFVVLWLLLMAGMALAQCPVKSASEKIVKPLICLDTLGRSVTPDSAHITTYKDDATYATYFARSTTFPFTAASIDTTRPPIGGTAPVLYWLSETISNIDGTASNATLAINVQLWWKGYATDNMYCVQMVSDSLNDVIWKLAALTAGPLEPTTAGRKLDVNAGGEAGLDFDNTSGTLAKTTDITGFNDLAASALPDSALISRINRRMWGVQLGGGTSSDSLTAAQRQSALSPSGARLGVNTLELNGTSQTARDIGASVLLSSGTGTGQLSITSGIANVNVQQLSTDATAADNAESFFDGTGYAGTGNTIPTVTTAGGWDATKTDSVLQALDYTNNTRPVARATANTVIAVDGSGNVSASGGGGGISESDMWTMLDTAYCQAVRDAFGDTVATFTNSHALTDSMRLVAHDSSRAFVQGVKDKTDSLRFAGVLQNPSFLQPTTSGRRLDVTSTGEAGIDLDNTAGTLAKTTDITGFNDIAATAVVSSGAITTSGGAVSTVTTVTNLTNAPTSGDLTSTMKTSVAQSVWNAATNSYAVVGSFGQRDSSQYVYSKEMHDSLDTQGWAATGSGGGGTVTTYPSLERIAIVDGVGAIPKFQFVIDTTAIGGSSEYALLNKGFAIRDVDDGKWFGRGVFERINCVGDLCTLQVADSLPFAVEAGDSVFIKGDEPVYVIASLSEAAAAVASTSLEGAYADSTLGGLLKLIAEGAGASGFDSTLFLEMMQAHGWYATFDSLGLRVTRGNSFSLPLAGDLFSQAQFEAFNLNIGKIKGSTTLVIDTSRNASGLGGGGGSGTGAYACTLSVFDGATAIPGAIIHVTNSSETAVLGGHDADANGQWVFNLDSGYVKVRILYPNSTQSSNPQTVHVTSAGANDTIQISILEGLKSLFLMALRDNEGVLSGAYVQFELLNIPKGDFAIDTSAGTALTGTKFVTNADDNGIISQELFRNVNIKFARSGKYNETEWQMKAVRLGRSLDNPDIEFKFKISTNDSTYFRPSGF